MAAVRVATGNRAGPCVTTYDDVSTPRARGKRGRGVDSYPPRVARDSLHTRGRGLGSYKSKGDATLALPLNQM